jgi:hypothetical protein
MMKLMEELRVHDTKIGVIVQDDLEAWQKLNVTSFLTAGVATSAPESIGKQYEDGSGSTYLPIFAQPVFVYAATAEHLQRTRKRALSREVSVAIYVSGMFATSNDVDNRAIVKAAISDKLDIVGLAFRCDRNDFDKIINGLKLHP